MNAKAHESILREALKNSQILAATLQFLIRANLDSDLFPFDAKRHFDNAPNVSILFSRWDKGLHTWFRQAQEYAAPGRFNRKRSLRAFAQATHALADFYAHTDWVEMQGDLLAPLTGKTFPVEQFPPDLSSGYFSLWYGMSGCPRRGGTFSPPHPYRHCHATIAKDDPHEGHGAEHSPNGRTYFDIAFSCAVQATQNLWEEFCGDILARYDEGTLQRLISQD